MVAGKVKIGINGMLCLCFYYTSESVLFFLFGNGSALSMCVWVLDLDLLWSIGSGVVINEVFDGFLNRIRKNRTFGC